MTKFLLLCLKILFFIAGKGFGGRRERV